MKKSIYKLFTCCLLSICLSGCEDWLGGSEPKPPQPQEPMYREYLEFKVNGVVWEPAVPISITGSGTKWFSYYLNNNLFVASANNLVRAYDPIKYFRLCHPSTLNVGENEIHVSANAPFLTLSVDVGQALWDEFKSIPESAYFNIKQIDTVTHRISGEFSATLVNDASDTLRLAEGKFDLNVLFETSN